MHLNTSVYHYQGQDVCVSSTFHALGYMENRLIQDSDGTVTIIPKSPAYVVGERVLGPLIRRGTSYCSWACATLRSGFALVDRVFTRAINFLPVAEAAPTAMTTLESAVSSQMSVALNMDLDGVATVVSGLPPNDKIKLLANTQFRADYRKFTAQIEDLEKFIVSKGLTYQLFQGLVDAQCENLQRIELALKRESTQATDLFNPRIKQKLILQLPICTYKDHKRDCKQRLAFKGDDGEIIIGDTIPEGDTTCQGNPIIDVLIKRLPLHLADLAAYNVGGGSVQFNRAQLEQLFSNQIINENTLITIKAYKDYVDREIGKIKGLAVEHIEEREQKIIKRIREHINKLYLAHKNALKADTYYQLNKSPHETQYVHEWKVQEYNHYKWTLMIFGGWYDHFSFKLINGTTTP